MFSVLGLVLLLLLLLLLLLVIGVVVVVVVVVFLVKTNLKPIGLGSCILKILIFLNTKHMYTFSH